MKKIIAAFDGLKYSRSTRDYAIQLAKQTSAHLVGVFLEDFTYSSYKVYDLIHEKGGFIGVAKKKFDKKDQKTRATAVTDFEAACQKEGLKYTVHHDRNVAIRELLHESIYADFLIVGSHETLTYNTEKLPTEFITELLVHVQCPVMVVPHRFKPIDKLVLLYDGEPSSVFAIKMFSYSLAALKVFPTEVVSVNTTKGSAHVPENKLMKEFMKRHFPTASYTVLKGLPEPEIVNYLQKQKEGSLVVLGAYRRGMVSRWFRASMADALMKDLKLPLFIAHNK
ncbi:MAG: universal stress protein [Chitinophagaceae bacterium]